MFNLHVRKTEKQTKRKRKKEKKMTKNMPYVINTTECLHSGFYCSKMMEMVVTAGEYTTCKAPVK